MGVPRCSVDSLSSIFFIIFAEVKRLLKCVNNFGKGNFFLLVDEALHIHKCVLNLFSMLEVSHLELLDNFLDATNNLNLEKEKIGELWLRFMDSDGKGELKNRFVVTMRDSPSDFQLKVCCY